MFEVIPAIDILDSKCVRLKQGRYDRETIYAKDPLEVAKKWESQGAVRIHVIDLDGARTGSPKNIEIIKSIAKGINIPIQVGGGIRNLKLIRELIDSGIDRVILGTTAVNNPNMLGKFCQEFGNQIAVAIDAKDGKAATEGWTKVSKKDVLALAQEGIELGVKRFILTDISRDGMLTGPNFDGIKKFIAAISVPVIASGGISCNEDIEKLKSTGSEGCIVGKALYEGKIKLEEII
ncbi:MAG: 1-(5-phosphoribosyl)-5-[(5-phosphoribosylamino)methylideneamino]imidazole-4-carboxamide isomerase [Candidatus Saganbacteria bacterium]|nr:1-(5-phosphoribosyl)-5-[(5-phosphoribosylamino)methylideneamino]imidazole-4-carboxamide isomerase [Candidatus Saganbacteria bacterium]